MGSIFRVNSNYNIAKMPELSLEQKRFRRLELLLLDNPHGFYESHLKSNLNCSDGTLSDLLKELNAKQINGFWVHPHYYFNIRADGAQYITDPIRLKKVIQENIVSGAILEDQNVSIFHLLKLSRFSNPADLIPVIENAWRYAADKKQQTLFSHYMYRRFNLHYVVFLK